MTRNKYVAIALLAAVATAAAFLIAGSAGLPYCPGFTEEEIENATKQSLSAAFSDVRVESAEQTLCDRGVARYQVVANADGNRLLVQLVGDESGLRVPLG